LAVAATPSYAQKGVKDYFPLAVGSQWNYRGRFSSEGSKPVDLLAWDYTHPGRPDVVDTRHVLENYLGGSPTSAPRAYTTASPIEHVGAQSPPTPFLHGGHDQLVRPENVERIIPKLAAAGVPFTYVYLPWANHGFDYNFDGWGSQIAQPEIVSFLDRHL
jgi:acetyl esterase/lipase